MKRVKLEREPIRSRQCGLIERDRAASRYALTEQGRAVLAALLAKDER